MEWTWNKIIFLRYIVIGLYKFLDIHPVNEIVDIILLFYLEHNLITAPQKRTAEPDGKKIEN